MLLLSVFSNNAITHLALFRRIMAPAKIAALVLLASWLLWRSGGRWADQGLRRPRPIWRVLALVVGGYLGGELAAGLVAQFVFPALHLRAPAAPLFLSALKGNLAAYLYWMIPVTWGSAAFGEEMLFRGFVLNRIRQLLGGRAIWAAVILQGLLFGAAHAYLGAAGAIVAGVLGLVLGVVYVLGGRNLWACFLIHGLVDSTSMTAVFLGLAPH